MDKIKTKSSAAGDDAEIIKNILQGDVNSYELLMRRYNQRLYRIGKSFLNDDDEIEDVIQTAYILAYENLSRFEHRSAFSTWLTRIFINEAMARQKYRQRFHSDFVNEQDNMPGPENNNQPDNKTVNNELKEILEKAIDSLPEKYRSVFIMHELENISVRETGDYLDLTESNVKIRLNRARKMLRDSLSLYYKSDDIYSFNLVRCDAIVSHVLEYISNNKLKIDD